jgi:hypothetical protein
MPLLVREFQPTPNPNAVKCVLDQRVPPLHTAANPAGPRAYRSVDAAQHDPFAMALLAIPGVTHVLIADTWLTVAKSPDANWSDLKPAVQRVLRDVP